MTSIQFSSVGQSCLTLCDPKNHSTPGLPVHHHLPEYPNPCPSSRWCHPAISPTVIPFSCPQSFPASGSFPMSSYMTTGKTISLTRQTFVSKVMSAFKYAIQVGHNFPSRSKHLLISWLQSPSTVILEHKKIKSHTVFTVLPSISHEVMGPDAIILVFSTLNFLRQFFHSPPSLSSRGSLVLLHFLS